MVPNGWEVKNLEDLEGSDRPVVKAGPFGSSLKKEFYTKTGYKIYGQEQVIADDAFYGDYYIDEERYRSLRSCAVEPDDILISLVGTIGKVLLVPENAQPGVINPRLLRISLNKTQMSSKFFKYFLESRPTVNLLDRWAQGGTMGVLNAATLKALKVPVPPLPEQQKIAKILSTWDKAISTTERLIDNSTQQKKALMQQLLTGKKQLLDESGQPFDKKWERIELGKLLDYKQPTPYLVKSTDYSDEYPTPVLTAGKTFILGYTDEEFGIFSEDLPTIIFDDFTTASKFVDFPFKAKSSAMKMLVAKDGVSIKYIFEVMQALSYAIGGHQRHWISIFANIVIGLPCREEQQKITAVSNNADKEIELLEQQLADLQQEKKALMQQLLTGKRRVVVDGDNLA